MIWFLIAYILIGFVICIYQIRNWITDPIESLGLLIAWPLFIIMWLWVQFHEWVSNL